jgi:regulator of sirC expression with transglutaminase-like and TPR domain
MNKEKQFRKAVREIIRQELDEATTTAAVPGYQTPFAFGDKEDEKREDDIEDFLDTYDYELAELVKKMREGELTESEREELEDYISQVRSMRQGDVESYRKKSNYYPHNED